jgi:DNA-3-methyladenine glycosylase II
MPTTADPHRRAVNHLRRADPKLALVIEKVGRCTMSPQTDGTHFGALVRAIVFQQLSGKAAATIHGRLLDLCPGRSVDAATLLEIPDETLRAAGLSRQKIGYLRDLAAKTASGALPLDHVESLGDDALIEHLVQVKGIGRWSAQMFLMFRLGRPDVLPELDLGIQNAVHKAYRLRSRPTPQRVREIGKPWSPYSTVASWYLWRSLDNR